MHLAITILILVVLILWGLPIISAFGGALIYATLTMDLNVGALLPSGYSRLNTVVLLAIPLFILAGGVMQRGELGGKLVSFINLFVGRFVGGLGAVGVIACAAFGAISGSAAATLSCIGSIMFPQLEKSGYDRGQAVSLIICASPLGLLIPPSSIQILYAWSSNQSVLVCFLSTVGPGLLLTFLLSVVNWLLSRRRLKLESRPQAEIIPEVPAQSKLAVTKSALPALLMPFIILGGIYSGKFTPTEAAAISVIYAVPVGFFIYKTLTIKNFFEALRESGVTCGVLMTMLLVVMILSRVFVMQGLPQQLMSLFRSISADKLMILLMINIFMVLIGMLMDDVSGTLLCTPLLLPLIISLGVSPIQFAAILGVNLGMGNITPPTAPLLYLGGRLGNASVRQMMRPTLWLLVGAWLPTLIVTTYWPPLSLWLPSLFVGRPLW
ncbi:MAG: TRAP transporter large permease [Candidatus Adiutrix sp.]|jgi:tripartite ATP-independent transporter DctM subunit|nr:TRAP transporter large permease [Candidatus Adiutrix sp.]